MPEDAPPPPTRWLGPEGRWLLGICLSRAGFVTIVSTFAASVPVLMPEWGMSAEQAGWVHSVWFLGYLTSLFYLGFLVDRFGAKRVCLTAGAFAAVTALAFAWFAHDFTSGLLLYGLTALFSGGSYTPALALIAGEVAPQRRGRAMGFYVASGAAGAATSYLVSGLMLRWSGWRAAFLATACGPALGWVVLAWTLRHTPNVRPAPTAEGAREPAPDLGMVRAVLANPRAMLNIWAYAWHNWELLGMRPWISAFLAAAVGSGRFGSTRAASRGALYAAGLFLVGVFGNVSGGAASDRWGRTRVILWFSAFSMLISFTLGWLLAAPVWLLVGVGLLYHFSTIADSPVLSTQLSELVVPQYLGAAYSVRSVLGFGTGVISPVVFGMVLDSAKAATGTMGTLAWGLAFSSLGLGALLGPLGTLWQGRLERAGRASASTA